MPAGICLGLQLPGGKRRTKQTETALSREADPIGNRLNCASLPQSQADREGCSAMQKLHQERQAPRLCQVSLRTRPRAGRVSAVKNMKSFLKDTEVLLQP